MSSLALVTAVTAATAALRLLPTVRRPRSQPGSSAPLVAASLERARRVQPDWASPRAEPGVATGRTPRRRCRGASTTVAHPGRRRRARHRLGNIPHHLATRHTQITKESSMQITGLRFVGTRTPRRAEMAAFLRDVLRLDASVVPGVDIDLFQLPDGSSFRRGGRDRTTADGRVHRRRPRQRRHGAATCWDRDRPRGLIQPTSPVRALPSPRRPALRTHRTDKRAERPLKGVSPNLGLSAVELASLRSPEARTSVGSEGVARICRRAAWRGGVGGGDVEGCGRHRLGVAERVAVPYRGEPGGCRRR